MTSVKLIIVIVTSGVTNSDRRLSGGVGTWVPYYASEVGLV